MRTHQLLLAAFTLLLLACNDDDPTIVKTGKDPIDLSNKSTPLVALESALNKRSLGDYDNVLDANFTFYVLPEDVAHGFPEKWGRADELFYMSTILDPNYTGTHPVKDISVDIQFPHLIQWVGESHGDETWYATVLFNQYEFDIDPDVFTSPLGAKVRFVVRNVGTAEHPAWKIAEWWDLGGNQSLATASATSAKAKSWGQIKLLHGQ